MKHKHADLIHAWADGAEVQYSFGEDVWHDTNRPEWRIDIEYRIKPKEKKPVVRWLWASKAGLTLFGVFSSDCPNKDLYPVKLEWSRTEFPE